MPFAERLLELAITVVLIIGGYQFYFYASGSAGARRVLSRDAARCDDLLRSALGVGLFGLYYPMILLAALSVATMVDLTIWREWPMVGHACAAFPLLIAISALKTKQHYVVDVIPGAILGAAVFFAWQFVLGN
jgi:hypothetical protein